jgi:crotonobetainyl-CoA:carnitine CoA-transferase CaiB-like acyl-CoA transferase
VASLLAVFHRDRTGHGQQVTGSLLGAGVLTNSETYLDASGRPAPVATVDHQQTGTSPGHRLYRLSDGWLALCARTEEELTLVCSVLGAAGPGHLEAVLAGAECGPTIRSLLAAGISCEPVAFDQGEAFLDDPLSRSLGLVASYPHAEWGRLEQVGAFWDFGDLEVTLDRAPPALGQHTVEVLTAVGLDADAIGDLLDRTVVVQARSDVPPG